MYRNKDKLMLKLKVTSSPAGCRKDANYILDTKQINNIVHQSLHKFSMLALAYYHVSYSLLGGQLVRNRYNNIRSITRSNL